MATNELYYTLIANSFLFLAEQIVIALLVYNDGAGWKLTFAKNGNLHPVQSTWKVAAVIFGISFLIFPVINYVFWNDIINFAESLQYSFVMLLSLSAGAFLSIWRGLKKKWDKWQMLLFAIQILLAVLVLYLNYS